jgi:hypothetical protein
MIVKEKGPWNGSDGKSHNLVKKGINFQIMANLTIPIDMLQNMKILQVILYQSQGKQSFLEPITKVKKL